MTGPRHGTRRGRAARRLGLAVGVLWILCWLGGAGAASAAADTGSATMVGEPGDYVSGGQSLLFDSTSGAISLSGTESASSGVATVGASGPAGGGSSFNLSFAAPAGQPLAAGVYPDAARYPFEAAGQAGIDVSGAGRGCNQEFGSFRVLDVHANASGAIDRLWVLYEVHCESPGAPALFGEVRVNEPTGAPYAEPSAAAWPGSDFGRPTGVVPFTIFAGPVARQVTAVTLTGPQAAAFAIRLDQCSGQTLAAGGSCQVFVRYAPTAAGATDGADLHVADADATTVDIPLTGHTLAGTTRVDLQSDPGDPIGGGGQGGYDPSDAAITATGTRHHITFSVAGDDGTSFTADFASGNGDILAPGSTYAMVTRYPFNNQGPGMSISGNGGGCNTLSGQFTVTDLGVDAGGNVKDAGVEFVQHCEGGTPALRGSFQWRALTPAVILASNLTPPTVTGTPQAGATLTASPGTWDDPATRFGYQWERCDATSCADIPGATQAAYAVTPADVGARLDVKVNLTNGGGQSAFVLSDATAVVLPALPTPTTPPAVTGTPKEGVQLGSQTGTWTSSPTGYAYQWRACDAGGGACVPIAAATGPNYTAAPGDVGHTLRVQVVASNDAGSAPAADSPATGPVAPLDPPSNTGPPQLTGQAQSGATLSVSPGTWSPSPAGYAYQWLRCDAAAANCQPVPGATGSAYVIAAADAGFTLRATVAARDDGGSSAAVASNPSARVPAAAAAPPPAAFAETLTVAPHQTAKSVATHGLLVTVGCNQACTATLSARGPVRARGPRASAAATVPLAAGARRSLRLHVHHGPAHRLTLTATAKTTAVPHLAAPAMTRLVVLI